MDKEILISTGLSQIPYDQEKYYYRISEHAKFLSKIGLKDFKVYPRMTRDFLLDFDNHQACSYAERILRDIKINAIPIFEKIDNRGSSLFITLTYPKKLNKDDLIQVSENLTIDANNEFVFVAVKNGMHNGLYCFTTQNYAFEQLNQKHVKELYTYMQKRVLG